MTEVTPDAIVRQLRGVLLCHLGAIRQKTAALRAEGGASEK